jgi:hypothetical protein
MATSLSVPGGLSKMIVVALTQSSVAVSKVNMLSYMEY